MKKDNKTDETYVPLSRGWAEHLADLSGCAVKVYNYILIHAKFMGKNRGKLGISIADLARDLKMGYKTAHRALKTLTPRYIIYTPAKNQYDLTVFEVKKYKTVSDFAYVKKDTSSNNSLRSKRHKRGHKQVIGTFDKTNGEGDLQNRNNVNNGKNVLREDSSLKNPLEDKLREALSEKKFK